MEVTILGDSSLSLSQSMLRPGIIVLQIPILIADLLEDRRLSAKSGGTAREIVKVCISIPRFLLWASSSPMFDKQRAIVALQSATLSPKTSFKHMNIRHRPWNARLFEIISCDKSAGPINSKRRIIWPT